MHEAVDSWQESAPGRLGSGDEKSHALSEWPVPPLPPPVEAGEPIIESMNRIGENPQPSREKSNGRRSANS
eukprot:7722031-Pyramimonas_sp.AAC.1